MTASPTQLGWTTRLLDGSDMAAEYSSRGKETVVSSEESGVRRQE
jgi:hypothetical protein